MGTERGGGPIDLFRRPLDPLQARGHFFYVTKTASPPVDRLEPARRAGDYRIEETGLRSPRDRHIAERHRDGYRRSRRIPRVRFWLAHPAREQVE